MGRLILPRRFRSQPQYPTQIDREGLGKGVQLLINPALGPVDLATGRVWVPNGNASPSVDQKGRVLNFDGVDDDYHYTGYPEIAGNVGTFFAWLPRVGNSDSFGVVLFGDSAVYFFPTNSSGGYVIYNFASKSTNAFPAFFNTTNRSTVFASGGTAATLNVYLDGSDSGCVFTTAPANWGAGNRLIALGRYAAGSTWDFDGSVLLAGYTTVTWGAAEAKAFHQNPFALFKTQGRSLWPVPAGGGGVTATVAYVNTDDTSSASASPVITGSVATTNADDISNAVIESETITATVAVTNADDVSVANATPVIVGESATTNADDVSAANASPVVSASAANINADDVSDASAAVGSEVVGSVAYTNIDDVSNAAAISTVTGSVAAVNADDSSSATLQATITASVATTNADDVSVAYSGAVVDGSVAVTNADDVSAAVASPVVSASSATVNIDDVSAADAIAEAGEVIASVAVTNADDVSAAVAAPVIVGSVAYSNLHDLSAAVAVINFGTIVEAHLKTGIVQESRIKKPGIPADAPEWQRTMFEILTGRRGNKIDMAPHQVLTFSPTPTKEECEALYNYISDVRKSMEQLTKRFDS